MSAPKDPHQLNAAKAAKKKKLLKNPEANFLFELNSCSKAKDLDGAISLYDSAVSGEIRLNQQHFNTLLYLCGASIDEEDKKSLALTHGFRIFDHMRSLNIPPNEASITAVSRLAAAKGDGEYAFEIVRKMGEHGLTPRLRTYEPALLCFCQKLEAEKAYEVEEHMRAVDVSLEEPGIAALLKVSAETGRGDRVYNYLQKLRSCVRSVSEETARILEDWFCGKGSEVGGGMHHVDSVKEAVLRNGGGWHGLGWLGEGKWVVRKGTVESSGLCCSCGEKLACVDIDDMETEKFAQSVAELALQREVKANFRQFQEWLEKHAGYEAVVDGANIGLHQQNFAEGGFSVSQLDAVVREMYHRSGNKWPLIVLHIKRVQAIQKNPSYRQLVEEWKNKGVLYTTPHGSNDDWYWLYAAVRLRCLLVTNDEMRDHIFELLGTSFFLKWKERHQVHYAFQKGSLKLHMPPPFSLVIQESYKGSWHVPIQCENKGESSNSWLCITRPGSQETKGEDAALMETSNYNSCDSEILPSSNEGIHSGQNSHNKTASVTGKRKERSPFSTST